MAGFAGEGSFARRTWLLRRARPLPLARGTVAGSDGRPVVVPDLRVGWSGHSRGSLAGQAGGLVESAARFVDGGEVGTLQWQIMLDESPAGLSRAADHFPQKMTSFVMRFFKV